MRGRILILAAAAAAMAACTTTATTTDTAADEAKLRTDAPAWFDRYNAGDAEGVAALHTDDAIVMPPGSAPLVGRQAITSYLTTDIAASKAAGIMLNNGEITGVGVGGDVAWMSGTFTVTDASGATVDTGKYLSLYNRVGGEWKLVRDIWNSDAAPAAAPAPATPAPATPPAG